jgi:hypothetical protein
LPIPAIPLTHADVKAILRKTAKDIGDLGFDHNSGYGIIQAQAAYELIDKSPNPPKPKPKPK